VTRIESFTRMFQAGTAHGDVISRVEIPLIQRDYAQGRRGEKVDAIRANFLSVLHDALAGDDPDPIGLDFVYGERKPDGTLQPLDGQQRLTTLFLLHWYLAARSGNLASATGWTNFSYETRPSARRFCQRLVTAEPPEDAHSPSAWIQEQPWYLFVWRYDPTINSMLVMIDAIAEQFASLDAELAWQRLTNADRPAISFHLLPLPDMGSAEDLYVKMNSRGRPLTDFENFKARFEKVISWSPRADEFAHKTDTAWSDVLWQFRGEDDLVDDEFLRFFEFVTEVCEWTDDELGSKAGDSFTRRAARVFGADNPRRKEHLDFLFTAFDVWVGRDPKEVFDKLFHTQAPVRIPTGETLPLFFRDPNPNLFESACRSYGGGTGATRNFTFGQTLLLLAVVLHLAPNYAASDVEFATRIRTLRNLIEGSQFEMRAERMPRLVSDACALILNGDLPEPGSTFAVAQITDEAEKRAFLVDHAESADALKAIEDNYVLKGSTAAFTLDAGKLAVRGATFNQLMADPSLWWDLTGALLTFGDYQWPRERNGTLEDSNTFQFGTWDGRYSDAWREVLVGRARSDSAATSEVLTEFLDALAESSAPIRETLVQMQGQWLRGREASKDFDWRYYLVKYRMMRDGASGLYYAHGRRMGFSLTNLPGGKKYRNANFRDPYLLTIYDGLGSPAELRSPWFSGYEWDPRWMRLTRSAVGIRAVPEGFQIQGPSDNVFHAVFEDAARHLGAEAMDDDTQTLVITVAKATEDPAGPDTEDRIAVGIEIAKRFIEMGL